MTVIACRDCGCVNEQATALMNDLQEQIRLVEVELRAKRSQIAKIQADALAALSASEHYDVACRVLGFWQNVCAPKAKEPTAVKRLKPCIARLDGGYTEHELNLAVMGYAAFPYVVDGRRARQGPADRKFVDAELIFRDAKHVEQGHRLMQRANEEGAKR